MGAGNIRALSSSCGAVMYPHGPVRTQSASAPSIVQFRMMVLLQMTKIISYSISGSSKLYRCSTSTQYCRGACVTDDCPGHLSVGTEFERAWAFHSSYSLPALWVPPQTSMRRPSALIWLVCTEHHMRMRIRILLTPRDPIEHHSYMTWYDSMQSR